MQGGLGNQLFQLAFGHWLKRVTGYRIIFDKSSYDYDQYDRTLVVDKISLQDDFVIFNNEEIDTMSSFIENDMNSISLENEIVDFVNSNENVYFSGYWQNKKFVSSEFIAMVLLGIMDYCKGNLNDGQYLNKLYVGVHVRRHDYKHHGLASELYYVNSIKKFTYGKQCVVGLLSDEPNYSLYFLNANGINAHYLGSANPLQDIYKLSKFSRLVLSNSTFSWWAYVLSNAKATFPMPWSALHKVNLNLFDRNCELVENSCESY